MKEKLNELIENIRQKANSDISNTKESRARKGAYIDAVVMIKQLIESEDSKEKRFKTIPLCDCKQGSEGNNFDARFHIICDNCGNPSKYCIKL